MVAKSEAWRVLTTITNYGHVPTRKQGEVILNVGRQVSTKWAGYPVAAMEATLAKLKATVRAG